ncbi:MAG: PD-(D/E)XK nuclease family protein [Bacteroidales bacterium]|nr:PD-(D/E)XK nuclease family protein [Bacteroidales bacterium]
MMETDFLDRVTSYVLSIKDIDPGDMAIVLPNKRARLYLKQHFLNQVKSPVWLPNIYTIEDVMAAWSGRFLADRLSLRLMMMEIYLETNQSDLASFASWTDEFLNDFDDIDHQLVDPKAIYTYLSQAKAIELWHTDGSDLTPYETQYLNFYNSIYTYYNRLQEKLIAIGAGYPGSLMRSIALQPISELLSKIREKHIVFAGFNAFTKAESKVIISLCQEKKASLLWDMDEYYALKNKFGYHEAGFFFRKFAEKHPDLTTNWINSRLLHDEKSCVISGIPGNVSQVKAVGDLLKSLTENSDWNPKKTAVVLADENLLIPLLNSIPNEVGPYNVTMGIPLRHSTVYSFLIQLIDLITSIQTDGSNKPSFKTSSLAVLLSNETWTSISSLSAELSPLKLWIAKQSSYQISVDDLIQLVCKDENSEAKEIIKLLISATDTKVSTILQVVKDVLNHIFLLMDEGKSAEKIILNGMLETALKMINRFILLLQGRDELVDLKSLLKIIRTLSMSFKTNFIGEPLEGLQVMGMLETRNLDFERVILLSVNEGTLPTVKPQSTMITADIRNAFGISGHREQQYISAYHFFRLLHRPKHIHLFYNTEPDLLGGGEKSRFIMQIIKELAVINPKINIKEQIISHPVRTSFTISPIDIPKTGNIQKLLEKKAETGFSPTILSNYVICPLKFCLNDLLGVKVAESFEDILGADTLGNIVHQALNSIYEPSVNLELNTGYLEDKISHVSDIVEEVFRLNHKLSLINSGKNKLLAEVAKKFVEQFLQYELGLIRNQKQKVIIKALELEMDSILIVDNRQVKIKGTADRIELRDGKINVIDYKTGKVDPGELKVLDWQDLIVRDKHIKSLQLAIYLMLYHRKHGSMNSQMVSGRIMAFRSISKGYLEAIFPSGDSPLTAETIAQNTETTLISLLAEIFDVSIPFRQTENTQVCRFCQFQKLCDRHEKSRWSGQ